MKPITINRSPVTNSYKHRQLSFETKSIVGRFLRAIRRRKARREFERQRKILTGSLDVEFPGLPKMRAVIQGAVRTSSSRGNVSAQELIILSSVCALKRPQKIVEFGTYDGLTTLHFAMNSPHDAQVITLDLSPDDPLRVPDTEDTFYTRGVVVGSHFEGSDESRRIRQVFGDSRKFNHKELHKQVDFIFVDGGHTYEIVKSDSEKAFDMLSPGGVIFWHDYSFVHAGVYSYLNEITGRVPLITLPGTSLVFHQTSI